jgi:hypothetical protein
MAKNKTVETDVSIDEFLQSYVDNEQKRAESYQLIDLMRRWTGFEPKMWGASIIGFGSYHYKYASGHEGDAAMIGFSPRKSAFSLYVYSPIKEHEHFLYKLGKFKMGKACIYVKKLEDIDISILEEMAKATIKYLNEHHECACHN